ncbi:MAG TPA: ATP-dependent zinc metalloprotease FtsH [Vicinamibacterales bacterium]|nr:ATP-dependent zinc metalloprotease FtsH [Vicinamibacterales bacterium]
MSGRKLPRNRLIWIVAGVLMFIAGAATALRFGATADRTSVPFSDFLRDVQANQVKAVVSEGDAVEFERHDGARFQTVAPQGYIALNPTFVASLIERGVRFDVKGGDQSRSGNYTVLILGVLLSCAVGLTMYRLLTGRVPSLEKARTIDPQDVTVTFNDVAGVDEAKDEVREIVEFLREPARFAAIGGRIPRGILLVGPPGTGKTLLARSMAGEAGVPFISASGSEFVEMYAGVGAARIRKLFREARRHKSCIVFIDELDAVGRNRGGNSLSHEEREQTLNQLLVEMDGFARSDSIVVVAATNRADILDAALLRPGRFDRQVTVGHPDLKGREQILRVHTRAIAMEPDIDLRSIARGTPGFSGADLANLVNEAALSAARAGRSTICNADLDGARDKVLMGVERKSVVMSEHERVTCAYHEAGHAVVAALLPDADPLHKVTIIPRGRALGVTMQLPEADRHTHSKAFIEAQIAILMGGRVAEELCLRQMTSGASNDIERATDLARKMVCELGMSSLGPVHFRRPSSAWETDNRAAGFSEEAARRVDTEISALVMRGYETARQIVERQRGAVRALALELLDVESVDADRVKQILAQHLVQPRPLASEAPDAGDARSRTES